MSVDWNAHRFSGGVLALSAANTVVHRDDPGRRFDRFDDLAEPARFARAASGFCADEFGGRPLVVDDPQREHGEIVAIREAVDALFRPMVRHGSAANGLPGELLGTAVNVFGDGAVVLAPTGLAYRASAARIPLASAIAISALGLLRPEALSRIRICPNCGWLFVDRSRNASRLWCDMAVCGNRAKARKHYRSKRNREVQE